MLPHSLVLWTHSYARLLIVATLLLKAAVTSNKVKSHGNNARHNCCTCDKWGRTKPQITDTENIEQSLNQLATCFAHGWLVEMPIWHSLRSMAPPHVTRTVSQHQILFLLSGEGLGMRLTIILLACTLCSSPDCHYMYSCTCLTADARLQLFGSSANGFGSLKSDLDICMTLEGDTEVRFRVFLSQLATCFSMLHNNWTVADISLHYNFLYAKHKICTSQDCVMHSQNLEFV